MNIIVCIKQVPDTTEIKIDPVKGTLIREGVPSIMNPDAILQRLNDDFSDSGRGLPIIMKIAPEISRQRYGTLNETTFLIPLEQSIHQDEQ